MVHPTTCIVFFAVLALTRRVGGNSQSEAEVCSSASQFELRERKALYDVDGFSSPYTVLDADSPEHLRVRAGFDAMDEHESLQSNFADLATRAKTYQSMIDRHFEQQWLWELATAPSVLDIVESLIGPDIMLMSTHIFVKHPPASQTADAETNVSASVFVDWHQDATYWGLDDPENVITLWYAIDPSTSANGAMQVIPGTHRQALQHGKSEVSGNLLAANQAVLVNDSMRETIVDLELQPGQASMHHGMLLHGSLPNLSRSRRCGVTLRYFPPSVKQVVQTHNAKSSWPAVCVRGEDKFGNFGARALPGFAQSHHAGAVE